MSRQKKSEETGEAFKKLLEQKGFNQYKLVQATGLDKSLISKIANGFTASPKPVTLEKIAVALKVELGELTRIFAQLHNSATPQAQQLITEVTVSKDPNFVGREEAIAHLNDLVNEGAKVILIQAKGGVGKATLARKFFQEKGLQPFEIRIGMETQDITPVEKLLQDWLKSDFKEEPNEDFGMMLKQLKRKLEAHKIGVFIHNLESALDGKGKFIPPHRRYVELLNLLADPDVQSITIVTSRECLNESKLKVELYKLPSLDEMAWRDFFSSQKIDTDFQAFTDIHKAYGGNAKAMEILCDVVIKQESYKGDIQAYWQANQADLLIEGKLEDLVASQFNRLQQLDPDAYRLLCRLGCYRYQNLPSVTIEGLLCLLWDVPEELQKRVVKSLEDYKSLVECKNGEYWLHPVIRQEAISRLKRNGEWESANGRAIKFWQIYFSHILKTEQLEINKIDFNLVENYQEKLDLIIETAEAIANYNIYKDELVVIEFIHHSLKFYDLESLEELILQSNIYENTGFSLLREKISEFVEWRINLGKSLYELGEPTHTLAVIDKKEGKFTESKEQFTYYKRCFYVGQRFLKTALDIANQLKLYRLVNEVQLLLARFQSYSID
ncbi:TPR repeat-containing protein [Tolypothrix sp. NIES-4075]|uniref:helix-turn-helix domain-containing protein n=1 Tax=Tolypothrix sp. NIES-4075 TaxID=2005459 RepID=UPI000B703745|nr:helix-turn-helix transcriptional regulator [Tolypothrix sp. NIES-4075]GAX40274.1 TPR repeat-containing protein [Tolypothrix sp. NIES-4075]